MTNADTNGQESTSKRTMVVVIPIIILFLLAVIAVPSFFKARKQSHRNDCLNNLRMIDAATESRALETRQRDGDPVDIVGICYYMKGSTMPVCPSGGEYIITTIGTYPKCSLHGELLREADLLYD